MVAAQSQQVWPLLRIGPPEVLHFQAEILGKVLPKLLEPLFTWDLHHPLVLLAFCCQGAAISFDDSGCKRSAVGLYSVHSRCCFSDLCHRGLVRATPADAW